MILKITQSSCSIFFFNRFVVHDIFFLHFFCARIFFWYLPNPPPPPPQISNGPSLSALAALVKSITDQRMSPPIDTFLFMSSWKSLIMLISLSGHPYICRIFHNVCLSTASKAFEKCIRKPHQVASVA